MATEFDFEAGFDETPSASLKDFDFDFEGEGPADIEEAEIKKIATPDLGIDLSPPDLPGYEIPDEAVKAITDKVQDAKDFIVDLTSKKPEKFGEKPEFGPEAVGEPRILAKFLGLPFVPGEKFARMGGPETEVTAIEDIEKKGASISDVGGELMASTAKFFHELPGPKKVKYAKGEMKPEEIGKKVGRIMAEVGVGMAGASAIFKAIGVGYETLRPLMKYVEPGKRQLVVQTAEDMVKGLEKAGVEEKEIIKALRRFGDEEAFKAYKQKLIKDRGVKTIPDEEVIKAQAEAVKGTVKKPKKTEIKPSEVEKEPWEMNKDEFAKYIRKTQPNAESYQETVRRGIVEQALKENKNVPISVLDEFPDLKPKLKPWETGQTRPIKFDPNSTKNEGRFRFAPPRSVDPNYFDEGAYTSKGKETDFIRRNKVKGVELPKGIQAIVGKVKGKEEIQALRFNKKLFPQAKASKWLSQNAVKLGRPDLAPTPKPPKVSKVGQNIRTLRGFVKHIGKINPINFKGEVKDLPKSAQFLFKKSGVPIDDAVQQLIDDGWLDKGATVATFLEELRTNPDLLKRDRLGREIGEKKPHEKTEAEKTFEEQLNFEPEEPPEGDYITMDAADLPAGKKLTLIEGKTPDGWDIYEVQESEPFGPVKIVDGQTVTLKPGDKVQVLKSDLKKIEKPKKGTEVISPEGKYVDWNKPDVRKKDKLEATYYPVYNKDKSFSGWKTKSEIERIKSAKGKPTLKLDQGTYGKQRPEGIKKAVKAKQTGLGLKEKPSKGELFAKPKKEVKKKPLASIDITFEVPKGKKGKAPERPIMTQEQKRRREKAKETKRKQIEIADAKEAREYIRGFIQERRKNLNLATYETNLFVNDIEKVTTKTQREAMPFIIEKTDVPDKLNRPDIKKAYDEYKDALAPLAGQIGEHFDRGFQKMKANIKNMSAEQIEDYVTHVWDVGASRSKKQAVTNWFTTQNKYLKKRFIDTYFEGIEEFDLKPKTLDIGEIIRFHDSAMNRAIENSKFVEDVMSLKKDGVALIERADKAPNEWVYMDHPALKRALFIPGEAKIGERLHPDLREILNELGVAIGRRIPSVAFGKPVKKLGEYRPGEPPEVRFQRFFPSRTAAHEIGHHIDASLGLGDDFLNDYKNELYAINRERIEASKKIKGKYGPKYTESTEEQIAEFFATLFTEPEKALKIAPNATVDVLERLKADGTLTKLVDYDFEKEAKILIEEQLNTLLKLPVKVHPDLVGPLKVVFDSRYSLTIPVGDLDIDIIRAYEITNGILKKSILSLSLFHHLALGETGTATMGPSKTLNIYFNPVKIWDAMVKGELDIYKKHEIARRWISRGLQVGATHDIPVNMIQNKLNDFANKTRSLPIANRLTKFMATFNENWDKALWNYLHDTLKLYACEALGTKMNALEPLEPQMEEITQFVNDTFGGQNWDSLMVSPKMLQFMSWGLLSPDWTLSTVRQALSPTGIGAVHKETAKLRRKLGKWFWIKAGLYFGVGINILNAGFRKWDMKKNPQYYKGKRKDFIDYTMFGNTIGKKTNLFVGRYKDGTERYIRWGKQFRELFEFFFDEIGFSPITATLKKIGGKLSPVIQMLSQVFTGVSPSGFRNDDIYGKKGWDRTYGIFKVLIKSPIPFASRSLLDKNKEFHVTDIALPSSKGMTRYKSIELFKHAVTNKDERLLKEVYQFTLQNNLPAFTLFNAAITSLKAETTSELNKSRKTIEDLDKAMFKARRTGNYTDMKRIGNRMKRLNKEKIDRELGIKAYEQALQKMKQYLEEKKFEK